MPRLPPLPDLDWSSGAPRSREKDDVYFSGVGLAEKRQVFLAGCGLPEAWAGRERFAVGELGFGSGLSFLALWDLWRRNRPSAAARLDVLSFEGALMSAQDAERIQTFAMEGELGELSRLLLLRWPHRARGVQRIGLPDGVTLTLFVDDIAAALPQARGRIDAWFLDGFAPAKNPEMWSAEAMAHVARLSAPGARAASYAVAGEVRRNLEAAGFAIEKKPGFGRKKERLEARLLAPASSSPERGRSGEFSGKHEHRTGGGPAPELADRPAPHPIPTARSSANVAPPPLGGGGRSVTIIGAGIAGACAAHAFLRRGCEVTVVDKGASPGAGASGNPLALVMPRLDAADGPQARALVEAYLLARRAYRDAAREAVEELDVTHRPRGEAERQRFAKLLGDPPLDATFLRAIDPEDPGVGVHHLDAIAVKPSEALPRLLDGARLRFNTEVRSLSEIEADLIVICAGMGAAGIEGVAAPPVMGRLGQLECAPTSATPNAVADGGYVVEAFGHLVFGATFEVADGEPKVTDAARAQNLETLKRLRPDLKPGHLTSRASIRATTPDRFPFAGPMPENEKAPDADPAPSQFVRLIGGLGARGFLWGPLLAELVASEVFGEPLPVEANVAEALDPGRFGRRARKRSG